MLPARRSDLADLLKRDEAQRTGVYFLLGDDETTVGDARCYIGEADVVADRLRQELGELSAVDEEGDAGRGGPCRPRTRVRLDVLRPTVLSRAERRPARVVAILTASLATAMLFCFGTGLHPIPWLTSLAPVPAPLVATRLSLRVAATVAFFGYLLGRRVWRVHDHGASAAG